MPTRISAGVGDHPCSLLFISMISIDCKITNFFLYILYIGIMKVWDFLSQNITPKQLDIYFVTPRQY